VATPVEIPKLGNTVEECIISSWRKGKGDRVESGDIVVEIETDKATFEVTAPVAGTLIETFFAEGALVPVFTNIFVIGEAGEDAESFRPATAGAAPQPEIKTPAIVEALAARVAASSAPASGLLSPRARRFAEEHGMQSAAVAGSGPGGRVLEEDLRRAYYGAAPAAPVARRTTEQEPARVSPAATAAPAAGGKISTMRERIARRMRESLGSTAQYTLNGSADASGLLALRKRVKAAAGGPDININDMVVFATILALREMPELNVEFIDGRVVEHSEIHIGFAVDTPRGLLVPVVRDAHKLSIGELAARMKELTAQTQQGKVSADDLSGATFTLSNLGGLGIESFTPLLNPPQVAILGIGAVQLKPVRRDGKVEFIDSIGLSLTCDHQIIDGAPGARFLKVVKEKIEKVESLCTI